jgi:hypothetical protein
MAALRAARRRQRSEGNPECMIGFVSRWRMTIRRSVWSEIEGAAPPCQGIRQVHSWCPPGRSKSSSSLRSDLVIGYSGMGDRVRPERLIGSSGIRTARRPPPGRLPHVDLRPAPTVHSAGRLRWNSKGMLGRHGAMVLGRRFPRTNCFTRVRAVLAVAPNQAKISRSRTFRASA